MKKSVHLQPLHITIINSYPIFLEGLRSMLMLLKKEMHAAIHIFESGEKALLFLATNKTDIVLIDHQLKGLPGAEIVRRLLRFQPTTKVVAIAEFAANKDVTEMLDAGVHGVMKKNISATQLLDAIHTVLDNKKYYCNDIALMLLEHSETPKCETFILAHHLTNREMEILQLIAAGYTNKEIAAKLFLGIRTIETHRHKLMTKLDVHHTVGLIKLAMKKGLLNNAE